MQENRINNKEVIETAYRVVSHYIYDIESSRDIKQITVFECFINAEKIKSRKKRE